MVPGLSPHLLSILTAAQGILLSSATKHKSGRQAEQELYSLPQSPPLPVVHPCPLRHWPFLPLKKYHKFVIL